MYNREEWNRLLREANELRAKAFALDSNGLHVLATLKMEELQRLVRRADDDAARAAAAAAVRSHARAREGQPMKVEIVNQDGLTRELEFVRWEGVEQPAAVVRWSVAGTYRLDLRTNQLQGARGIILTNWRAVDVAELRILHARWLKGRSDATKPQALRGSR